MVERWAAGDDQPEQVVTIRPAGSPGKLQATLVSNGRTIEYGGKVKRDGSVSFVAKGLLSSGIGFGVRMEGPGAAVFNGGATGLDDMRAYSGQSAGSASVATWGKYVDMVGHDWLIRDGRGRFLVSMRWRVPGQVLVERFDALDSDGSFSQEIRLAPNGEGLIAETHPPYTRVGYGQVQANGRVEFKTRGVLSMGQSWSIGEESGRLRYRYDSIIDKAADSFCEKIDPTRARALLVEAEAARRQREVAKREEKRAANDRFLAAMGAISAGLEQANDLAAASEARSRAELDETLAEVAVQAERERVGQQAAADAQRQREITSARVATQRQFEEAQQLEATRRASEQRRAAASAGASGSMRTSAPARGGASTLDDANTCVSRPVVRPNDSCRKGTSAVVTNQCAVAVDVRMCTRTAKGWDCSVTYGLDSGRTWSQAWCEGTSEIFSDARNSSSSRPLASP